jgi:ATP-dependent DNA helicase DinG
MSRKLLDQIGQEASARIAPAASEVMRRAIAETGGREVFFAGQLDVSGIIQEVRVYARGNEGAVPALMEGLKLRDVVIHNHPSGTLAPSDADVQLASVYGFNGHGVFIVDNDVQRVYVVVEPVAGKTHKPIDAMSLADTFSPSGKLARVLPEFEVRPQQIAMMKQVAQAFNEDGIAVVEAPTGVGKTFAYLLPAAIWALENKERVVVSTRTINLQEQIIYKDIPLLAKCLDRKVTAVLVKGKGNYLCRRKLQQALSEAALFEDESDQRAIQAIADWAEQTDDGSLQSLPFVPTRSVWEQVNSDSDTCNVSNCPAAASCFVQKARRELAKADIIVANHHMLFSDLAIKKEIGSFSSLAVLPAYKRVIFDEAHNIEDSATEYFGAEVTRNGAVALLGRFVRIDRGRERGLIPYVKMEVMRGVVVLEQQEASEILNLIDNQLVPSLASLREALLTAFAALRSFVAERSGAIGREIKWRLTEGVLQDPGLRDIHKVYMLPAAREAMDCAESAGSLLRKLKAIQTPPGQLEHPLATELQQLQSYRDRLLRFSTSLAEGISEKLKENTVRWVEIDAKDDGIVRIAWRPLEVGKPLGEWVYPNLGAVAMTSATLSVEQRFDHFFKRVGLNMVKEREMATAVIDSPFDFEKQAILCIPTDIVRPDNKHFLDQSVDCMYEVLSITKGHALVLFTSFYALDHAYRKLKDSLEKLGIASLRQGDANRNLLLERFRSDASSVLFGTDSFWEGVDVAGDALQCVILPKLPFSVPTEPVLEARAEKIEAEGGNAFMEYTVPQAVIKLRQGLGRLIRRRTDRGAVIVLDQRIVTKHYGRVFLKSLPDMRVITGPREKVFLYLKRFFQQKGEWDGPRDSS